jgi:hypothetical protein
LGSEEYYEIIIGLFKDKRDLSIELNKLFELEKKIDIPEEVNEFKNLMEKSIEIIERVVENSEEKIESFRGIFKEAERKKKPWHLIKR